MVITPRLQSVAKRFLRSYLARIVVALILIVVVQVTFVWLTIVLPCQQEKKIAKEIESIGGIVGWSSVWPDWIPLFAFDMLPKWERIDAAFFSDKTVCDTGMAKLQRLSRLEMLDLNNTKANDFGLEHLKGLRRLKRVYLSQTQVTDDGLSHLSGLTSLEVLFLGSNTRTTPEGRETLRKSLPSCEIFPNP